MYRTHLTPGREAQNSSTYEATHHFRSMKNLVPSPLRRSPSPIRPRTSDGAPRLHQMRGDGRSVAYKRPVIRRIDDPRQARSVSPVYISPLQERHSKDPRSPRCQTRPAIREYLSADHNESLPYNRGPYLPPTQTSSDNLTLEPVKTTIPIRKCRQPVPSMIDYLTMEELEDVWEIQDIYRGTVDVPQKPTTPTQRTEEQDDPPSPLSPPTFRRQHHPFRHSYTQF